MMALWLAEKGVDEANVGNRFEIVDRGERYGTY